MSTKVTPVRYSTLLLGALLTMSTGIVLVGVSAVLVKIGYYTPGVFLLAVGVFFIGDAYALGGRGYNYQILSYVNREPTFTLDDVDPDELYDKGEITIYE